MHYARSIVVQSIIIDNLNDSLVEEFKLFAKSKGVTISIISENNLVTDAQPKTLTEALLRIPKSDDDEDIFAREEPENDYDSREIDWSD